MTELASDPLGKILCRIGIHRWGKKFGHDEFGSSVIEWKKKCQRCGKLLTWIEPKKRDYGRKRG
ncbi:MAG: hypothetical protein QHG99_02580 [Methanomicrobiales archaeon]|nr:hypothetical protein [Methanomicrobiales archaeon]